MNPFHFSDSPQRPHRVHCQPGGEHVLVDGTGVAVQALGAGLFSAQLDGQPQQVHAVADGDAVLVQWRGRAWRIERVDVTRSNAAAAGSEAGISRAPMPGVVVSLQAAPGQQVSAGEALLVIESMKLQMTIEAACSGTVQQLPLAAGQTFQRGAMLVLVEPDGEIL